ncbi:hypothetical protein EI555_010037, partial [Monodon monoceros]
NSSVKRLQRDLIGIYTGQPGLVEAGSGESAEYKRRTKYVQKSLNPEWNQTVIYKSISMEQNKLKALIMASPIPVKAASSPQSCLSSKVEAMVSSLTYPRTCRFPPLRNPIVVPVARNPHPKAISALMDHLAVKAKPASLRPTWKMQGLL